MNIRLTAWLLLVLSACNGTVSGQEATFVLEGDLSAFYTNGNFVVWKPKPSTDGKGATTMMSAPAMGAVKPKSLEETLDVIAKAPIQPDGTFRVEASVDEPRKVVFYVLNAIGPQGQRFAPVKGNVFILEPGQLRLRMSRPGRFVIEGGPYNDAVYNSWRLSEEYIETQREYYRLIQAVEGETEAENRERIDRYGEVFGHLLDIEREGRALVSTTHPDPLVRRLTIETAWLGGPWILEAYRGLVKMTPEDPWVVEELAKAEEAEAKRAKERKRFAVGQGILDFVAETLDGKLVQLADVRANSKLVLVEFWASWCGPCRVEIPHMKEAYARHRDKGFEIISFTIDDDRTDWEVASEEEDLPWPNLGMGQDAEAPLAYNVTGVPKNYLVESSTGEILAKDLRGHKLDETLAEFFQ